MNLLSSYSGYFISIHEGYRKWSSAISDAKEAQREVMGMRSFPGILPLSYPPQVYIDESMGNFAPTDSRNPPIFDAPTPSFNANTLSPSFSLASADTDSRTGKEKISGFRAWICNDCHKIVIEVHYAVESAQDLSIITRNDHICSRLPKCSTLQEAVLLALELKAKLEKLPLELKKQWEDGQAWMLIW